LATSSWRLNCRKGNFAACWIEYSSEGFLMSRVPIERCFQSPVIPVVWDPSEYVEILSKASSVILQGGSLADFSRVLDLFCAPLLEHLVLFVHIDLVAGLENNEAGLEYISRLKRVDG